MDQQLAIVSPPPAAPPVADDFAYQAPPGPLRPQKPGKRARFSDRVLQQTEDTTPKANGRVDPLCIPELDEMAQAIREKADEDVRNLEACTLAINGVQAALLSRCRIAGDKFAEGLVEYLREATVAYMRGASAPNPTYPPPAPKNRRAEEAKPPVAQAPRHQTNAATPPSAPPPAPAATENTWATVARKGNKKKGGKAATVAAAPPKESSAPAKAQKDSRLFLRLPAGCEWRLLAPMGIREELVRRTGCSPAKIGTISMVRTGFALKVEDAETRETLTAAGEKLPEGAKIEQASCWATFLLPSVPTGLNLAEGRVPVTGERVAGDILRVTGKTVEAVRPMGKGTPGAPTRTWLVHFKDENAPKPGFKVFDMSGLATAHQSRQTVQHCKRCLGFHATRGCSRAPACGKCGSTMHEEGRCESPSKCRNCGGPHRSDSRQCLARPTKAGPKSKEQLAAIRAVSNREYHAVARARAAAGRADSHEAAAAAQAAAQEEAASDMMEDASTTSL